MTIPQTDMLSALPNLLVKEAMKVVGRIERLANHGNLMTPGQKDKFVKLAFNTTIAYHTMLIILGVDNKQALETYIINATRAT